MATINSVPPAPLEPPPGLELVRDFINTLHTDGAIREDAIASPAALEHWLSERKLLRGRHRLSDSDVAHVLTVRESLRDLLEANDGKSVAKASVETLGRAARSAQLVMDFEPAGTARLRPAATGVDAALGEILANAFRAMTDGSWRRLKSCRDDGCRWAFYDRSKNHSGHWCSMASCGNRAKARRFRSKA